jgi:hypothetical protein
MWLKNTNGKKDAMLTFAAFSFLIVTLNVFLSTFGTVAVDNYSVTFQALDGSIMAIYLGSTFTAYVSRRWTDRKYKTDAENTVLQRQLTVPSSESDLEKTDEFEKPLSSLESIPAAVMEESSPQPIQSLVSEVVSDMAQDVIKDVVKDVAKSTGSKVEEVVSEALKPVQVNAQSLLEGTKKVSRTRKRIPQMEKFQ